MNSSFFSLNLIPEHLLQELDIQSAAPAVPTQPTEPLAPPKEQKRCGACKHKLLLSDTACRCGTRHCSKHRLPEDHACAFDHKAHDKGHLQKNLVACISDKMIRID